MDATITHQPREWERRRIRWATRHDDAVTMDLDCGHAQLRPPGFTIPMSLITLCDSCAAEAGRTRLAAES
jgi:hypothetical protein